jgi:hypothetical protein
VHQAMIGVRRQDPVRFTPDTDDCDTSIPENEEMSHQINLSSRDILPTYQNVLNANGIDWVLFTYDGTSNDLKVQSTGDGGLDELKDEFSGGR